MAGLADAFDLAMAHVAAHARDDPDRQVARDQHRPLLDVQLDPGRQTFRVEQRFASCDAVDVGAHRAHAIGEAFVAVRAARGEIGLGQAAEQSRRAQIGFAEARALLAAQREQF